MPIPSSMIRSASSAYEMRSEIVGALLSLNNNYSVFSVYTPQDNNAFPCAKEGSQNYWGLIQNGNDWEFPTAEKIMISKTAAIVYSTYYAINDNVDAYSVFTLNPPAHSVTCVGENIMEPGIFFPITTVTVSGINAGYPVKSIIERTVSDLWNIRR